MQTDQQLLGKMVQAVKEQEKQLRDRGLALHSEVLDNSSEDEESDVLIRSDFKGPGSFQSKLNRTMEQYQLRKERTEQWYKQKIEVLYKAYNKV